MSKINIILNNKKYSIDESVLSEAKSSLQSHLSTTMSGSGATINLGGTTYNIDSTKLTAATNDFVSHLGTIAGSGSSVVVNGVNYGVDSSKVSSAFDSFNAALNDLASSGGETLGFPITWNSMEVMGNPSVIVGGEMPFVKVSDFIPTAEDFAGTEMSAMGETLPCDGVQEMSGLIVATYAEGNILILSVATTGEYADLGVTFTETGLYVLDFGSMGMEADFTVALQMPTLATPVITLTDKILTITPVENATGYEVYFGNELICTTTETTVDLTEQLLKLTEKCDISVCAVSASGEYKNSELSTIKYSLPILAAPELSVSGQILTIKPVENATNYRVYIDDELVYTGTETTLDLGEQLLSLEKSCKIVVHASASSGYVASSSTIEYALPVLATPIITLTDKVLTIASTEIAVKYEVYIEDELICTTTETTVDLSDSLSDSDSCYISVRAIYLGYYFPSEYEYVWFSLTELAPGLYDANDVLLATWHSLINDYNLDITKRYTHSNYSTDKNSPYYVLNNNEELSAGVKLIISKGITTIGDCAFYECARLNSVAIPDSVTSIGHQAFDGCTSLTSIVIPDSVTSIGETAFCDCSSLTNIIIPDSVTSIGETAFCDCSSLTNIIIPDSVISIGNSAFFDCSSLTSVEIPDSVTTIGTSAFYGCSSLIDITVAPDNQRYKSINGNLYSKDGQILIQYATGKSDASFEIPNSVTSIGDNAFSNCDSLTNITIPDSVTSIGIFAFRWCSNLTSVVIPNSVTSIGSDAFSDFTSLTSITIPDSVISIGNRAFNGCANLDNIEFKGTMAQWNTVTKNYRWNYNVPATYVQCSDGQVSLV